MSKAAGGWEVHPATIIATPPRQPVPGEARGEPAPADGEPQPDEKKQKQVKNG